MSGAVKHTAGTVRQAQVLREGGWSYRQIAGLLGISSDSARRYCDPSYAERQWVMNRRSYARRQAARAIPADAFLSERALHLHAAGLSWASIAALYRHDYGETCTEDEVRRWARAGRWRPRTRGANRSERALKAVEQ